MPPQERYFVLKDDQKLGPFYPSEIAELCQGKALDCNSQLQSALSGELIPVGSIMAATAEPVIHESQPEPVTQTEKPSNPKRYIDREFQHDSITSTVHRIPTGIFEKLGYGLLVLFLALMRISLNFNGFSGRVLAVFLLLAVGLFLTSAYFYWHKTRVIIDTPTTKARSAAVGQAEFIGRVVSLNNICGPFSGLPCVIYQLTKKEGRNSSSRVLAAPFLLEDATGTILIDPDYSEIDFAKTHGDWDYEESVITGGYVRERLITPGEKIYVLGRVDSVISPEGQEHFMVHKGDSKDDFFIFQGDENLALRKLKNKGIFNLSVGLTLLIIAIRIFDN